MNNKSTSITLLVLSLFLFHPPILLWQAEVLFPRGSTLFSPPRSLHDVY
jgi:hypothetical protein